MENQESSSEQNKEEVKKIRLGLVLSWIFGVLFLISGVALLFSKPLLGILSFVVAVILLPPANELLKEKRVFQFLVD